MYMSQIVDYEDFKQKTSVDRKYILSYEDESFHDLVNFTN